MLYKPGRRPWSTSYVHVFVLRCNRWAPAHNFFQLYNVQRWFASICPECHGNTMDVHVPVLRPSITVTKCLEARSVRTFTSMLNKQDHPVWVSNGSLLRDVRWTPQDGPGMFRHIRPSKHISHVAMCSANTRPPASPEQRTAWSVSGPPWSRVPAPEQVGR